MGLDVVYMPLCKGYQFLVIACCNSSSWVEAKPLHTLSSQVIADFLWKNVIYHHGCFGKLIINGRSENKYTVAELTQRYWIKRVVVLVYHPQANGIIECGHKPIVDALLKMLDRGSTNWIQNLPTVL